MMRWPFLLSPIFKLLISIVIVGIFSLILFLLRPYLSTSVVALLYLVPVVICAALFSRMSGITASVLSFLIFNYFFITPYYTFLVAHPQDLLAITVLLGVAVLISSLMARIQSNLDQVRAREREAVQLYELSVELAGKNDQRTIAKVLAQRLAELFKHAIVEVEVILPEGVVCERASLEVASINPHHNVPPLGIPLSSPHGQLGEIRVSHLHEALQPQEERLLRTFVSQGALALDRAILMDSETRARVLEESDRLKTAILSSVSHELRTPLASIQAAASSLYNPKITLEESARSELLSLLLEETDHMAQLIGNLLNMSRIEAGALKLQRQWNSIAEIVDTGLRRLHRLVANQQIKVDVSEDLPLVSVDSVLMEQVIINLVRNSLKFAPRNTFIYIGAEVKEQRLIVTVSNQGPAIPEEFIRHVFEKFFPIPGREAFQGTGLGLSICKGIVEAHGGKIWAENLPKGVAFHFYLPLTWEGTLPVIPDEEMEGL
jgi:two-component system, OmpR family, sensor histidine kinase KdpD